MFGSYNINNFNLKSKEDKLKMDISLIFKIAGIGILISVIYQILVKAGREDQAMMVTLAGMIIVLTLIIKEISTLFETVRAVFEL